MKALFPYHFGGYPVCTGDSLDQINQCFLNFSVVTSAERSRGGGRERGKEEKKEEGREGGRDGFLESDKPMFPYYSSGYSSWHRDAHSIQAWVYNFLPSKVLKLRTGTFAQKVLDSTEPWVVDFFAPWCGHCQVFKPEFEKVAEVFLWYSVSF